MKAILIVVFLTCFFCAAGTTAAQPRQGMGSGLRFGRLAQELDLSDEQKKALVCDTPGQGREIRDNLLFERTELNRMLRDRSVPEDVVREQMEKVNRLQAAWNNYRFERLLQARKVLTPSQLEKLLSLQDEYGNHSHQ